MTYLTPHFSLEELTLSQSAQRMGIDNTPSSDDLANLQRLAATMEKVRALLNDKPILISSGFRCPEVNSAVGGARASAHCKGLAVDFTCPGYGSPRDIVALLRRYMGELEIDQLIHEFDAWVHLGLRAGEARCQCLTINRHGTSVFV